MSLVLVLKDFKYRGFLSGRDDVEGCYKNFEGYRGNDYARERCQEPASLFEKK